MEIRKLTPADADAYWHLRLEALEREPRAFTDSAEEHRRTTVESVAQRLAGNATDFVVGAFVDGHLAGMAGFYREHRLKTSYMGHIWGVYVRSQLARKGVGRAILQELITLARPQPGLENVILQVGTDNLAARRLYESLGFSVCGTLPQALRVNGEFVDEYRMMLKLTDR